jgi:hypothetical protein
MRTSQTPLLTILWLLAAMTFAFETAGCSGAAAPSMPGPPQSNFAQPNPTPRHSPSPTPAASPQIIVNVASPGALIHADTLGANMGVWFDPTRSGGAAALAGAGFHMTRWPGGSDSDA